MADELKVMNDEGTCFITEGSGQRSYCSLPASTDDEKKYLFNLINSPQEKLGDYVNMEIKIANVYAETCTYTNVETGEAQNGVRIILIDDKGKGYSSSSIGVFTSLTKIFKLFGEPHTWTKPIKAKVKQVNKDSTKRVYTLELV